MYYQVRFSLSRKGTAYDGLSPLMYLLLPTVVVLLLSDNRENCFKVLGQMISNVMYLQVGFVE